MQLIRLLHCGGRSRNVIFVVSALALSLLLDTPLQASESTLTRVRQTGTLKLGYYADARPFSYQDETGKPVGYAISLCQQIATDLKTDMGLANLDVQFVLVSGADRYDAVTQGKVDLLCGPSVETFTRRKQVSFSIPIFPAGLGALVRADAPAQIRDVLSGHEPPYRPLWRASMGLALQNRIFSAVTYTTALTWLTTKLDEFKIEARIVPVGSHDEGVARVLNRTSDVLFGERSMLLDTKKRSPEGKDLMVLDRLFTYEPFAFALVRDDEDLRLLVDRSLSSLIRSGQIQSLYKKFFGEPDESTLRFFRMNAIPE
jgi:ABC-type amino acid transport substrate-binding protein